ncbi:hypothetical protein B0H13DRAFT_1853271 [Mycena leptocephala]|nr:hypothetical protein B0H13DRAFT_1853271 [Mycena leptocephala]
MSTPAARDMRYPGVSKTSLLAARDMACTETIFDKEMVALPANILDEFRLFWPADTVEKWVESVRDWDSVRAIAAKVHRQLCSARDVARLRRQPAAKRDDRSHLRELCHRNVNAIYEEPF